MSSVAAASEAKARGNAAFSAGKYEDAIKEFSEAIRLNPSDHVFFSNRSACYAGLGEFEKALEDAEECVKLKPDWSKGYSRKGLALYKLGKLDDALETYQTGLKLDPENEQLKEGLESVQAEKRKGGNPFGQLFGPDVWAKIATNPKLSPLLADPGFVAKVQALQKNPEALSGMLGDPQIQALFSSLIGLDFSTAPGAGDEGFAQEGETEAEPERRESPVRPTPPPPAPKPAEEEVKKEATPEELEAEKAKNLGNDLYKAKKFDEAAEQYQKAFDLVPTNGVYLSNLAAVRFEQKKFQECIDICQKVVDLSVEHPIHFKTMAKVWSRMGNAYKKLDNVEKAIEAYRKSLVESYDRKLELEVTKLQEQKKKAEAEAYLSVEKAELHREQGNAFFKEGKWTDAIAEYSEAIKRNPKDPRIYSNRSACLTKIMDWGKALEDADMAIALDPTFVKAYLRKAKIHHFLKQYHKALTCYRKAQKIEPDGSDILEGLQETRAAIAAANASGEVDPERQKRAMEDPEIKAILGDPVMQKVLNSMKDDPKAASQAMRDPDVVEKLETLVAAGVVQMR